ncbi:ankyrin repeat-containing domain protein [Chaetomium fimeti]|uniref:Ankyrin repeat-containing domain protein n=1 Tax=Chaetomium fimeti TaxID=1854472 RepID=A0AAE0LNZ7_9PEZI|nr:ankyrin repeat-containing domain protein [Chaetomium fimeti]
MMFVAPDLALERRRTQNRIAQRRFREKQNRRNTTAWHENDSPPAPEHAHHPHAPAPAQEDHCEWASSPGPEDGWWSVEHVATINQTMDPSPPTSHGSTTSLNSGSTPVTAAYCVSKGALLTSQGLLMGDVGFLDFSHDLEVAAPDEQTHAPPNMAQLLPPPSHRSASPVEPGPELSEANRDDSRLSRRTRATPSVRNGVTRPPSGPSRRASTATAELPRDAENGTSTGSSDDDRDDSSGHQQPWQGPLHMAAVKGHDRIVRILLGHTADANEPDGHGRTPLMHAVAGGFEDVLQTLLAHGARVADADRAGRFALHWAVTYRRESLLRRLLDHCRAHQCLGLLDRPDGEGKTPLHLAIDMGFEAGVRQLLENGADPSSRAPCNL